MKFLWVVTFITVRGKLNQFRAPKTRLGSENIEFINYIIKELMGLLGNINAGLKLERLIAKLSWDSSLRLSSPADGVRPREMACGESTGTRGSSRGRRSRSRSPSRSCRNSWCRSSSCSRLGSRCPGRTWGCCRSRPARGSGSSWPWRSHLLRSGRNPSGWRCARRRGGSWPPRRPIPPSSRGRWGG